MNTYTKGVTKTKRLSLIIIAILFSITIGLTSASSLVFAGNDPTAVEVVVPIWQNDNHTDRVHGVVVDTDSENIYSSSRDGSIRRYDENGIENDSWRSDDYVTYYMPALDSSGNVYVGVNVGGGDYEIIKLDDDGDEAWSTEVDSWALSVDIDSSEDYLYAGLAQGNGLIRLDAEDGTIDSSWEYTDYTGIPSEIIVTDDYVYMSYYAGSNGGVHKVDISTGSSEWEYEYGNQVYGLAVSDDYVFAGGISDSIAKIDDTDGSEVEVWADVIDGTPRALEVYDDVLYIGGSVEMLLQVDFDGNIQATVDHPEQIESITTDNNGIVYTGSRLTSSPDSVVMKVDMGNTETRYSFDNVATGLNVRDTATDESIVLGEGYTTTLFPTILIGTDEGLPIATAGVLISASTQGRDFSGVTAATDVDESKSVLSGIQTLTGMEGGDIMFSLYVPKAAGDDEVHICPGASSLSEVTTDCDDRQVYLESDPEVTVTTVDGQAYWVVEGLTGTGGISVDSTPAEETEETEDETGLPDTGVGPASLTGSVDSGTAANTTAVAVAYITSAALGSAGFYLLRRFDS